MKPTTQRETAVNANAPMTANDLASCLESARTACTRAGRVGIPRWVEATTGAAPVPVPPPMPAVINSMSDPAITSWMVSASTGCSTGAGGEHDRRGYPPAGDPFPPPGQPLLVLARLQRVVCKIVECAQQGIAVTAQTRARRPVHDGQNRPGHDKLRQQ